MVSRKAGSSFYWYDFRIRGERFRGSTKETKVGPARSYATALFQQLSAGSSQQREKLTLRDFAPKFLTLIQTSRLEPKTKEYYANGWRLLKDQSIAGMRMDQISTSAATNITAPGGGSNANCALRTLRRMLSLASDLQIIGKTPRIHLAKENQREQTMTPQEEVALLAVASNTMRGILTLVLDTGMRPSEAASLAWQDIDLEKGVVLIVRGKTKASRRHLPLTTRAKEALGERMGNESEWVFPKRTKDAHICARSVSTRASKLKRKAGIRTDVVLYSARHTFATDFLEATGNVAKLQKALGHTSLATTQRYLHPDIAELGSVMDGRNADRQGKAYAGTVQ